MPFLNRLHRLIRQLHIAIPHNLTHLIKMRPQRRKRERPEIPIPAKPRCIQSRVVNQGRRKRHTKHPRKHSSVPRRESVEAALAKAAEHHHIQEVEEIRGFQ